MLTLGNPSISLGIQRHVQLHTLNVSRSIERLSSGRRITRAADDPAGLAIAERLRAKVASLGQAIRNASDGVSMLQIGEAAGGEVSDMLIRIRELAIQSANGTLSDGERAILDQEAQALIQEIDRIAAVTEFNGAKLLDGSTTTIDLQTGPNAGDVLAVPGVDLRAASLGGASVLTDVDISTQGGATTALGIVDAAIDEVAQARATQGTSQARIESRIRSLQIAEANTEAARSRIMDVDYASETASLTRSLLLQQVGISLLAQANAQQGIVLDLLDATFQNAPR